MDSPALVSIVTPFYNTREHLAECIESVLLQSYQHWEYILVDNCSDDGSSELAQQFASQFPSKIRLIRTKSFLSQVANYNFALTCISGASKYCKIVQADDWIYPECLERMIALAESDESIGIVSSYRLKGSRVLGEGLPYTQSVLTGRKVCRLQLTTSLFVFGTPTTVLYRSEIVRKTSPFYDERNFFDDADAAYEILRSWNFGFVHQVLSFSRVDDESIRGSVLDFGPDALDNFLQLSKFGPAYLEKQEMDRVFHRTKDEYYRLLAQRLLGRWNSQFWKFHASVLIAGGLRIDKLLLAKYVCIELVRLLTNPGSTCKRVYDRLLRSRKTVALKHEGLPKPSRQDFVA